MLKKGDKVRYSAYGVETLAPRDPNRIGIVHHLSRSGNEISITWSGNKWPDCGVWHEFVEEEKSDAAETRNTED